MKRTLSVYVNCSLGGMTSVYRARVLAQPEVHHDLVFLNDRGGQGAFEDIPNCSVRIVRKDRLKNYINYILSIYEYSGISITSLPELPSQIRWDGRMEVCYEFHSPIDSIIDKELDKLDLNSVDCIRTPSDWATDLVRSRLPRRKHVEIVTVPNIIDGQTFQPRGNLSMASGRPSQIPVLWIGRFENSQKNYADFLRVVSLLPEEYFGLMVVSLETDPARMAQALGAAAFYGVEDRIDVYLNVAQADMGEVHRMVARRGGVFCSTALSESFGYGVAEARRSGVPVATYDVGPLREHGTDNARFVPVGSLTGMAKAVIGLSAAVAVSTK